MKYAVFACNDAQGRYPLFFHNQRVRGNKMAVPESKYLLDLLRAKVCPWCGKNIPEGTRVGSGRKSEGGFCSLDCYTKYYALELQERAKRVSDLAKRNKPS